MKYVRMWAENGYCGCDVEDYLEYEDDIPEEDIDQDAQSMMYDNAEDFSYVATGWDEEWESEEEESDYYANCSCGWNYITEEEYLENTKRG